MNDVAVLFAREDSRYCSFAVDVWPASRNALLYEGPWPVVAHPPCRGWGRLRQFAKPRPGELDLARFAVHCVRSFGGVLEHPAGSALWAAEELPDPGAPTDRHGGWSLSVRQSDWGHAAPKWTWLYIVGCPPELVPPRPPSRVGNGRVVQLPVKQREATPPAFMHWLLSLAHRCNPD